MEADAGQSPIEPGSSAYPHIKPGLLRLDVLGMATRIRSRGSAPTVLAEEDE